MRSFNKSAERGMPSNFILMASSVVVYPRFKASVAMDSAVAASRDRLNESKSVLKSILTSRGYRALDLLQLVKAKARLASRVQCKILARKKANE